MSPRCHLALVHFLAMFGGNNNQADVQPLVQAGMTVLDSSAVHGDPNIAITGGDNQMLTITLAPGKSFVAQPGCMMWCEEGIHHEVASGGLSNALTRACCAGEDLFHVHWVNEAQIPQKISLTQSQISSVGQEQGAISVVIPKRVIAVNLDNHGNQIKFTSGAFMAAMDPNLEFNVERVGRQGGRTVGKAVFGGQGLFLCTARGKGMVFLSAYGTVLEKNLQAGETIVVDQSAVVAWADSVQFGYRFVHNFGMMVCGGEGLSNTTLTGPGFVILQSTTTPAAQQANPLGLVICAIWCCIFVTCFIGPAIGGVMGAAFEEEHDAPGQVQPPFWGDATGESGRRLVQNLTYEVGRRLLQNFTLFA